MSREGKPVLTDDQKKLMELAIECDGAEIDEAWWRDAEVLVEAGYATLSGRHGPGGQFKRITPITEPVYQGD